MSGTLFNGGGQRQQGVFGRFKRINAGDLRFAHGECAGLIERDVLNLTQLFQRRAAFDQCPTARRSGQTGSDRRRR
ncbi:hypothetical protein D3C80_1037280 [compost metagenome]